MNSSQCQLLGIDDYIKLVWVSAADAPGDLLQPYLLSRGDCFIFRSSSGYSSH